MRNIKKLLTIIALVSAASMGYAQTSIGTAAVEITSELKLPTRKEVGKKELCGKYTFAVELDGTLSNIAVKDSMGHGMDEQIIRRLSETKDWKVPVFDDGPRRIAYSLPIIIKIPRKDKERK